MAKTQFQQEPMAIIGFACRLPGGNNSPQRLWAFLEDGGIAPNTVPSSRFNFSGHWDGSHKPGTMRPAGGMFLSDDVDLGRFDAGFFEISGADATAMDPNQRQMLEVVYEGLENAGIPLEKLDGEPVACFVGSYATDYLDMMQRDAEDRPPGFLIGTGRAVMANRISYFLNIKGPSITLDTACSGSLVGLDLACRSLQAGEVNMAIVAASNLYLNPDHVMDMGSVGQAHSPTALCHSFDADADGYCKAEAVGCLLVKRLSDAVRDRDPIRAIVRGTSSNSNGRTRGTGGIAQPSGEMQAAAIRAAYANAGITDFNSTAFLECHGTGTPAGDPEEVHGAGSVFSPTRDPQRPLLIGSIKSNIGHSEPSAGISGLIKIILAMEKGIIPGNPTFWKPSPKIDFTGNKVKVSRTAIPWPDDGYSVRRASLNCFGFGGSNAHAVVDQPSKAERCNHISSYRGEEEEDVGDDTEVKGQSPLRPHTLVVSANDAVALKANISALCSHVANLSVDAPVDDLAYTLSERRSHLWHRAFVTTNTTDNLDESAFVLGKKTGHTPKIGLVFTGQGAQWPQMGKALLATFPQTREVLRELDGVLQSQPDPPRWSLETELSEPRSADHLRQPEFSQPLVTALQICILSLLQSWGVKASAVVGHSSGEIAASYAAGFLDRAGAIKAAFYRGRAAVNCAARKNTESETTVGMLAVGLGADQVEPFLAKHSNVWVACFNSPSSVTVSGKREALEALAEDIKAAGHFARILQVDLAYHSPLMRTIGDEYGRLLQEDRAFKPIVEDERDSDVAMYSSVTASKKIKPADAQYWISNMVSAVRFAEALKDLVSSEEPDILIEVGPSGALAGPVSQILKDKSLPGGGNVSYHASWARGSGAVKALLDVAGSVFVAGAPINLAAVNGGYASQRTVVDLPNYQWNHTVRYWHENATSVDWRNKRYITHDLLGSKIPGTSWKAPTWRKKLSIADVSWLQDHQMGSDVLVPGMAFTAMALEAMYQKHCVLHPEETKDIKGPADLAYRFRNVKFDRAVVVEEGKPTTLLLALVSVPGSNDWHEFRVFTTAAENQDIIYEHCKGLVRVQDVLGDEHALRGDDLAPLRHPQSAEPWYKVQREIGSHFGPSFRKIKQWETVSGQRTCRATLSLEPPPSSWEPQSSYPIHPAVLDVCQQTATAAFLAGERSTLKDVIILSQIDDMVINRVPHQLKDGLSVAEAVWTGRGREEYVDSWSTNVSIHDPDSGALFVRFRGLNYVRLDVEQKPDPHVFNSVKWKPDITHISQDQLLYMKTDAVTLMDEVLDLVAHKTPRLSVLEISLCDIDPVDASSIWLQGGSATSQSARVAFSYYTYAALDAQVQVAVEAANAGRGSNIKFQLLTPSQDDLGLSLPNSAYDLVIIQASANADVEVDQVLGKLKTVLKPDAFMLVVPGVDKSHPSSHIASSPVSDTASEGTDSDSETPSRSDSSTATTLDLKQLPRDPLSQRLLHVSWDRANANVLQIPGGPRAYLCRNKSISGADVGDIINQEKGEVFVARFSDTAPTLSHILRHAIEAWGYTVNEKPAAEFVLEDAVSKSSLTSAAAVLVMDELAGPVLTNISESHWEILKKLASSGKPVIWVTKGAQTDRVSEPENAMVQGLFRVAMREDPGVRLITLDVQSPASPDAHWAIERVLDTVLTNGADIDSEYAERDGVLLVPRIVVDKNLNKFKTADIGAGLEPIGKEFHTNEAQVRFQADKKGSLDNLAWCETAAGEVPVEPGKVDIQVMAMGINFKDVATTMGIVPENEQMIGCECAGFIRRLGTGVTGFNVGDRVVAQTNGTYVNHLQVVSDRVHVIPDSMSFEDATTIPLVYLTAIYSLYHLANLQEGQSVLIHSAAGGVGMAAIQLAQHKKCDVFVTVSTDEKRRLLASQFNIPANRMFSSRNTKFAEEIRRETNGRGVDVILNSLVGELLDESWRLTADGGVMVEIGKRDIVDRNTLAMEPFDRNCSFRAIDLSYVKQISDSLTGRLLREVFELVKDGHVGPIHPITTFPIEKAIDALSYIRQGQHMGKIVLSCTDQKLQLPIRPFMPKLELKPDVAYLIVGGLKGLCGSLAVHMARHGARHIIAMSRSGINDEASARVIRNCASYGCQISEARGDVSNADFVLSVFQSARRGFRIAGVVQAAMVLRDKPFEMMSHDDFHTAIRAKVAGTWNLHTASRQYQLQPLDFFTMLSSISSVVGNKGQANYAAANAFMDAFSFYRQGQGLRAHTVNLGLIEDVGYVAEVGGAALEARFDKREWTPINEGILRRILSYSIMQQGNSPGSLSTASVAQMVTGIAYPLPLAQSDLAGNSRFDYLFVSTSNNADDSGSGSGSDQAAQAIRAFRITYEAGEADAATLAKAVVPLLQDQITKLLRLETEMEPGKPLMAYGLDSLSAVELRSWVRQKLGGELSTLDITNASSLFVLGEKLVAKLPKPEPTGTVS
ncbi:hypothetical protein F4820DRAFT_469755 [Hypoxylon rubiginosum]|uniref:Uncharacterized protein n=1 Tax=Hypoxylon rubiginosum TaxID=110542 RepID=A0ACB9Z173_9PEZI|nr:hypothetical protein F4820DRAFT_469755 [Hypoxylon rubiginosum]